MPAGHTPAQAEEQTLNRHQSQTLLEQEIAHPQRQHRAETVTDELERFEQVHAERISGLSAEAGVIAIPNCILLGLIVFRVRTSVGLSSSGKEAN